MRSAESSARASARDRSSRCSPAATAPPSRTWASMLTSAIELLQGAPRASGRPAITPAWRATMTARACGCRRDGGDRGDVAGAAEIFIERALHRLVDDKRRQERIGVQQRSRGHVCVSHQCCYFWVGRSGGHRLRSRRLSQRRRDFLRGGQRGHCASCEVGIFGWIIGSVMRASAFESRPCRRRRPAALTSPCCGVRCCRCHARSPRTSGPLPRAGHGHGSRRHEKSSSPAGWPRRAAASRNSAGSLRRTTGGQARQSLAADILRDTRGIDHGFQQGIRRQPVGAVRAGAGDFTPGP